MNSNTDSTKSVNKKILWIIFLANLVFSIIYSFSDIPMKYAFKRYYAGDTIYYVNSANSMLKNGMDIFINQQLPLYYSLVPVILVPLIWIIPQNYEAAFVLLQCLFSALTVTLLYLIALRLFNQKIALLSATLYFFMWDIFRWNAYVQTESLYTLSIAVSLYLLLSLFDKHKTQYLHFLAIILVLCSLLRPAAILFVLIIFAWLVYLSLRTGRLKQYLQYFLPVFFILGFILVGSKQGRVIDSVDRSLGMKNYLSDFKKYFESGQIIYDLPDWKIESELTEGEIPLRFMLKIIATRIIAFWSPYLSFYSNSQIIYKLLIVAPVILLGGGTLCYCVIRTKLQSNYIIFSIIILYTLFHSMTIIDFDHRYRSPLLLLLIPYACFCANKTYDYLKNSICSRGK